MNSKWQKERPGWYDIDGSMGLVLLEFDYSGRREVQVMTVKSVAKNFRLIGSHFDHDYPAPIWWSSEPIEVPPMPEETS